MPLGGRPKDNVNIRAFVWVSSALLRGLMNETLWPISVEEWGKSDIKPSENGIMVGIVLQCCAFPCISNKTIWQFEPDSEA
jgi:hypothetical protein